MNGRVYDAVAERPIWWPVAVLATISAFFLAYLAIGSLLYVLFPPPEHAEILFRFGRPGQRTAITRQAMLAGNVGMLASMLVAGVFYRWLRGDSPAEAVVAVAVPAAKLTLATGAWVVGLVAIGWLTTRGGFVGFVGFALLVVYLLASAAVYVPFYRANTPPYTENY